MRWLWENSELQELRKCHRLRYGGEIRVFSLPDGGGFFGGFCRCHSVWACPLCATAIRSGRAQELGRALRAFLSAGGGALHSTFTLPHNQGDRLSPLFSAVASSWRAVCQDKVVRQMRGDYHLEFVRSTEVTVGERNGWHPHLHVGEVAPVPLTREQVIEYRAELFRSWCSAVVRHEFRPPSDRYGLSVVRADASQIEYGQKVEGLANELVRLDRKTKGKTDAPFTVLRRAVAGDEKAHGLWAEYERGTKGRRALGYSKGFKTLCPVVEVPEDELVEPTKEAVLVGTLRGPLADMLVAHPQGFEGFLELVGPGTPEAFLAACTWLRGTAPLFLDPHNVWEDLKTLARLENPQPEQGVMF